MTTLAMAAVLSLAAQCAPGVAPDTIAAIAMAESGLDPFAIHDNTVQRTFQFANLPAAIAVATDLIVAQHHSVDLGLMQVNSANLAALGLSIADAFDACRSSRRAAECCPRRISGPSAVPCRSTTPAISNVALRTATSAMSSMRPSQFRRSRQALRRLRAAACVPEPHSAAGWDVFAQSGGTPFVFTGK